MIRKLHTTATIRRTLCVLALAAMLTLTACKKDQMTSFSATESKSATPTKPEYDVGWSRNA